MCKTETVWIVSFSEWDINMKDRVFSSKEALLKAIDTSSTDYSIEEALLEGLLEIKEVTVE
jgi:hypothetical protein